PGLQRLAYGKPISLIGFGITKVAITPQSYTLVALLFFSPSDRCKVAAFCYNAAPFAGSGPQ
ncbi:MAG TPA: hypothetical protein VFY01_10945, partial [Rheinheimera sp.]|nr:hypothetical protein [Rheinheimera sp.]